MNEVNKVTDVDIYKAIGHLDEATEVMQQNQDTDSKNEEQFIGIISFIGRVIKALISK